MLQELTVQNLALIEDVRVELRDGFCAWTGETGAGKSLLMGALGLLLGERAQSDLIRAGTDELRVTGRFELCRPDLREDVEGLLGSALEDEELILARRVNRAGRSYAYANDQPVALATLRALGSALVDVHGQRESHSLLQPSYQLRLLDGFARLDDLRRQYRDRAEAVRSLRRELRDLTARQQERQRELALLQFEREELGAAALRPGEAVELPRERDRLLHAQSLREVAAGAAAQIYDEEGSVVERLGKLARDVDHWSAVDSALTEAARRLAGVIPELEDLAGTFRSLGEQYEADPARLDEVERRLQALRRLEKKYGKTAEELIVYQATLDEREAELRRRETDASNVQTRLAAALTELRAIGEDLSAKRQKAARRLATAAQKHLAELGMAEARLSVEIERLPYPDDVEREVPSDGFDMIEMMLAANKGEPALPLRKVASGGELSRTMLALRTVLADHDSAGTVVFDEIDANVGGRLGDVLGQKLAALGLTHQVICVTHLPQVASFAQHQWTIQKAVQGKRTITTIRLLDEGERLEELANMLRGAARGETTRQEAAAMLAAAKRRS